MTHLISIIVGVITGIASSYMVWRYVILLRPKLGISSKLAITSEKVEGKYTIRFKVVNKGPRIIYNVEVFLNGLKKRSDGNADLKSEVFQIDDFKFSSELALGSLKDYTDVWSLSPFTIFTAYSEKPPLELFDACDRLSVRVVAVDEQSGSLFYARQYYDKKDCVEGDFGGGSEFGITPHTDSTEQVTEANP